MDKRGHSADGSTERLLADHSTDSVAHASPGSFLASPAGAASSTSSPKTIGSLVQPSSSCHLSVERLLSSASIFESSADHPGMATNSDGVNVNNNNINYYNGSNNNSINYCSNEERVDSLNHHHHHQRRHHHHHRHRQLRHAASKLERHQNFAQPMELKTQDCSLCVSNPITPSTFDPRAPVSPDQATSETRLTGRSKRRSRRPDSSAVEFQLLSSNSVFDANRSGLAVASQTTTNVSLSHLVDLTAPMDERNGGSSPGSSSNRSDACGERRISVDPDSNLSLPNIFSLSPPNSAAAAVVDP